MAHRRALAAGIGASAALHVFFVLIYSVVVNQWGPAETVIAVESVSRFTSDMRVVRVVEIALPELSVAPPEVPELTAEAPPDFDAGPPVGVDVDLDEPPRSRRAADVLRVRSSDARLWREAMPELFELTDAERMQLELAGRLEEWTDSVAEVVAANMRSRTGPPQMTRGGGGASRLGSSIWAASRFHCRSTSVGTPCSGNRLRGARGRIRTSSTAPTARP